MKKAIQLQHSFKPDILDAGCDEAGRGCYAGPVFAAAVILPENFFHPQLNDSKQISARVRGMLRSYIEQNALAWKVVAIEVSEIDSMNILKASQKAMHRALDGLSIRPQFISVDGNYFIPYKDLPYQCIIKGDAQYAHIAAASILAKTHRDEYMSKLHYEFPEYNWKSNKGYGTLEHRKAIAQHGLSIHHRKSFNINKTQLSIFSEE